MSPNNYNNSIMQHAKPATTQGSTNRILNTNLIPSVGNKSKMPIDYESPKKSFNKGKEIKAQTPNLLNDLKVNQEKNNKIEIIETVHGNSLNGIKDSEFYNLPTIGGTQGKISSNKAVSGQGPSENLNSNTSFLVKKSIEIKSTPNEPAQVVPVITPITATAEEQELLVTLANLNQKQVNEITTNEITEGELPMALDQSNQNDINDINMEELSKLNDISEYGDIGVITGEQTIDKENAEKLKNVEK